jgi:hypothetical protein
MWSVKKQSNAPKVPPAPSRRLKRADFAQLQMGSKRMHGARGVAPLTLVMCLTPRTKAILLHDGRSTWLSITERNFTESPCKS